MSSVIKSIENGSPASKTRISVGDRLLFINGSEINDVLDYKYHSYDKNLVLELEDDGGKRKKIKIKKPEGMDIGLDFETYLMDKARSCSNKCVFCFIDQLPKGMRETLYFKDDDARLSFLQGNYITLTNLSEREARRIIDLHISPINVSVHTTDPELRCRMLGNKNAGRGIEIMKQFCDAGIKLNCQIVCCPEINDGEVLSRTLSDLIDMYPGVSSVSVVPVGLTKHRSDLPALKPFDTAISKDTIARVDKAGEQCLENFGTRLFFCADEMYIEAGLDIPDDEYYEDYPQLENGVGMLRLLTEEFCASLEDYDCASDEPFSIVTGCAAAEYLTNLLYLAETKCDTINGRVYPIRNDFFGEMVDVAGLVTGGDIIDQLSDKELGTRILIPKNMLRYGGDVFLDDVKLSDVEEKLNVSVRVVMQDGEDLAKAIFGQ